MNKNVSRGEDGQLRSKALLSSAVGSCCELHRVSCAYREKSGGDMELVN